MKLLLLLALFLPIQNAFSQYFENLSFTSLECKSMSPAGHYQLSIEPKQNAEKRTELIATVKKEKKAKYNILTRPEGLPVLAKLNDKCQIEIREFTPPSQKVDRDQLHWVMDIEGKRQTSHALLKERAKWEFTLSQKKIENLFHQLLECKIKDLKIDAAKFKNCLPKTTTKTEYIVDDDPYSYQQRNPPTTGPAGGSF